MSALQIRTEPRFTVDRMQFAPTSPLFLFLFLARD